MAKYKIPKNTKVYEYEYTGADPETGKPENITYSFCRINDYLIFSWEGTVDIIFDDVDDLCCDFIIGLITGRLNDDYIARKFGFESVQDAFNEYLKNEEDVEDTARFFESVNACGEAYPDPDTDTLYRCLAPSNMQIWS